MSTVNPIKFVFTGHVDSGKSTLSGRLLYHSGAVPEHQMEELRRKAEANKMKTWEYAYLLDVYDEEQARGKTIEYNLVEFTYQGQRYQLVDCPGHQVYIRSLLAGLNVTRPSETIGCLVVSLAEGEYEAGMGGGQTREDTLLLRATGITELIVVLNKIDLVPVESPRYQKIKAEIENYVKKLGFRTVRLLPVSAYHGQGLSELLELLRELHRTMPPPPVQTPLITASTIKIQARLMYDEDYKLLFSVGFAFVLHCGTQEYQVTIDQLSDANGTQRLPFAVNGTVVTAVVTCSSGFQVRLGDRVILRTEGRTIGFGAVRG